MINGQLMVYRFNDIHNAVKDGKRNLFTLKDMNVNDSLGFRSLIEDSLDEVPPGQGYVLVKWNKRLFVCEKDSNNPATKYIQREISYHPLMEMFGQR